MNVREQAHIQKQGRDNSAIRVPPIDKRAREGHGPRTLKFRSVCDGARG